MQSTIDLKLFATLKKFEPQNATKFPIKAGMSVKELLELLNLPYHKVKLIFINNVICDFSTILNGGERVGIFPPVGGG